jgi:hypothetical protein
MMKKYLFIISLMFATTISVAQDTITRNAPLQLSRNASITVYPLIIDLNSWNGFVGGGFRGYYRWENTFGIEAGFQKNYLEKKNKVNIYDESTVRPAIEGRPAQQWHVNTKWYFVKKTRYSKSKVILDQQNYGDRKVITYTKVPSNIGILYSLSLGINHGITAVNIKGKSRTTAIEVGNPSNKIIITDRTVGTTLSYSIMNLGLTKTWLTDVAINAQNYGRRDNKHFTEFYADLLFATQLKMDNIYIGRAYTLPWMNYPTEYLDFKEYSVNHKQNFRRMGARVGVLSHPLRVFGFYLGVETGLRPGPRMNKIAGHYYFNFRVGLNFSAKIKK